MGLVPGVQAAGRLRQVDLVSAEPLQLRWRQLQWLRESLYDPLAAKNTGKTIDLVWDNDG